MHVVIAGSSGFIGGHLHRTLRAAGHSVATLVRRPPRAPDEAAWDPVAGVLPSAMLRDADVVINLCGAPIGDRRWSAGRKRLLRSSRLQPTALLAAACARLGVPTLINASAVGIYGDREDETLTEASDPGGGFVADLCRDWETAAQCATDAGIRVVTIRTGLVLGPDGGMLPRLARLTKALLGGRLGTGNQWWPWISIADHVSAIAMLCRSDIAGPVNLTAPNPVTNREFTAQLAAVAHRPAPWIIPPVALRLALGGFAREILASQRAVPEALSQAGFRFVHPDLDTALRAYAG